MHLFIIKREEKVYSLSKFYEIIILDSFLNLDKLEKV